MATNKWQFFIIGFEHDNPRLPRFVERRFGSYAEADQYLDDNLDELEKMFFNIQIYQMDDKRNFIEQ